MLSTLIKIGEQLLEGKDDWSRLTAEPKYSEEKENWICPIVFDCISKDIYVLREKIELFEPGGSAIDYRYVPPALWGPRGKKCALTVEPKNFSMLVETLFGKESGESGSMMRAIEEYPKLIATPLFNALKEINLVLAEQRGKLDLSDIKKHLDFGSQNEIVLFYSVIISNNINGAKPAKLIDLEGYEEFITTRFGTRENGEVGMDYVTGGYTSSAVTANFTGRYNIHKIFQTTASNYASGFSDFKPNFQVDPSTIAALDKASDYVLKKLQPRIAGITHIVIPHFLHKNLAGFDLSDTEIFLERSSELLFKYNTLDAAIEKELPETGLFWVNYIAFESDGNSFKIMNHIKDVNSAYLRQVINVFNQSGLDFKAYLGTKNTFNLQSIYFIVPVRDGNKSKNNPALHLFKDILEQRSIEAESLLEHFITLTLCHWYGRYKAFPNIRSKESFDFAIKDAVFQYSAFIYALKQLNLINMENSEPKTGEVTENANSEFEKRMSDFFLKMDYSENEKAVFFLGRVLSSVAYAQYKKGHTSKPILNKINFNGMDSQAIVRLSLELAEKARQYNIHYETEWNFARFRENFNEKNWRLSSVQNVFYLMTGYSFGLTKPDNN